MNFKKNWDIILSCAFLILGIILSLISGFICEDLGCYILIFPLAIISGLFVLFSIITIMRTFVKKMNKKRLWWAFPLLLYFGLRIYGSLI